MIGRVDGCLGDHYSPYAAVIVRMMGDCVVNG